MKFSSAKNIRSQLKERCRIRNFNFAFPHAEREIPRAIISQETKKREREKKKKKKSRIIGIKGIKGIKKDRLK